MEPKTQSETDFRADCCKVQSASNAGIIAPQPLRGKNSGVAEWDAVESVVSARIARKIRAVNTDRIYGAMGDKNEAPVLGSWVQ